MNDNILSSKKVHQALLGVLGFLTLFLLAKAITEFKKIPTIGDEIFNAITVSGKGEVTATADVATFSFSIHEEGITVAEAQEKATTKNNKALQFLKDSGIEEKDIQTTGYNVSPKYDYSSAPCTPYSCPISNPKISGYQIDQSVTVKVRDIAKAGDLLTKVGAIGVSNISGLSFTIDDEEVLKSEAREKAIMDAKVKAKKLAKDLGVSLGKVTSFYETNEPGMYYSSKAEMGFGGGGVATPSIAPDIATGENKVIVNVSITYRIK